MVIFRGKGVNRRKLLVGCLWGTAVAGESDVGPHLLCRYSGWMTEAKRRNEDDWHESLDNESVCSLSRLFYDSYAKGHCSGSVAGKVSRSIQANLRHSLSFIVVLVLNPLFIWSRVCT